MEGSELRQIESFSSDRNQHIFWGGIQIGARQFLRRENILFRAL